MIVSRYFVWFVIYSIMGWIYESIYCTIKGHKWENRGFLFGPLCPIYGFGGILASFLFSGVYFKEISNLEIFLYSFLGSIVLEYGTSLLLEKVFHAVWWDYSDMPLNVNGRICLPASIGFGLGGLLVIHVIFPFVYDVTQHISDIPLAILAIVCAGVMGADTAVTVSALTGLVQNLQTIEENVNVQLENAYAALEDSIRGTRDLVYQKKDDFIASAVDKKDAFSTSLSNNITNTLVNDVSTITSSISKITGRNNKKNEELTDEELALKIKDHKRQEYTQIAMRNVARFLNKSQKHVLHSVKRFSMTDSLNIASEQLRTVEKEVKKKRRNK
ncbi:Uncharacterized membrane protein [Lachnospiraceae bacterium C7]|nr:Uncharacterized membrane protein [Lachnospiraceae bacterium C7]